MNNCIKRLSINKLILLLFSLCFISLTFFVACEDPAPVVQWETISPGGETICGDGSPFEFFYHEGTVNNVLVYFQGGGACWSNATCAMGMGATSINVDNTSISDQGIFEFDNTSNPFKGWSMIYVPYCSADIHWGDAVEEYDSGTVHFKGYVNNMRVLNWIYSKFQNPENVFVTGVSAGGYGCRMYHVHLLEHYKTISKNIIMVADSAAGVIDYDWYLEAFPVWGAYENRPMWVPGIGDTAFEDLGMKEIMVAALNYYPNHLAAEYNTYDDAVQKTFYAAQGGAVRDFSEELVDYTEAVKSNTENYRYFLAPGREHGIMDYERFYTTEVNGVLFRDWVAQLASGQNVSDVRCPECN